VRAYLVTGGAGFIGSHLVEELVRRGEQVRVLDNFLTGRRENIAPFLDKIELIEGDIRDLETCRRAVKGVDYVLHQAALISVPLSMKDPVTTHDVNISGTLHLLWASIEARIKRFIFASSAAVYGDDGRLPQKEGNEGRPLSPYALSKSFGEKYCHFFHHSHALETISLRYFNVFGPRQDPLSPYASVIPLFIEKALAGERLQIYGDGEQSRDFIFVSDVVEANLRAAAAPAEAAGCVYNIACGERTTVNALAAEISRHAGTSVEAVHADPRPGDIRHSFADVSRARSALGFSPGVDFQEGMKRTFSWYGKRRSNEPGM
jgi:nucleoside-diphosphate-sugar epimerase